MYQRVGKTAFKKNLNNITALCEALGNPQNAFKSIHIAGTNGKGTTAHILSAVFQSNQFKTGLYTSPHYKDFRERIKIDGHYIPEENVVSFVELHKALFEKLKPSFFEITVAMAFDHFAKCKVDIAIIETGLGGRLDSTNIINPELSVITNISLDHTQMLGNTLAEIASEKAGIIKKRTPVVVGERNPETDGVFDQKASVAGSTITYAEDNFSIEIINEKLDHIVLDVYYLNKLLIKDLSVNLKGKFLLKNLISSFEAIKVWNTTNRRNRIGINTLRKGLLNLKKTANYIGRWQILGQKPLIIGDSAHNPGAFRILFEELNKLPCEQLHIVTGFVEDKDLDKSFDLFPKKARYYFSQANIPRAKKVAHLKEEALKFGLKGEAYEKVNDAYKAAKSSANEKDIVLVCGSIFILAEVL